MLFVLFALVELFFDALSCRQTVDEEASKKLEVWPHSIAVLPAVGHNLVDLVGTLIGLR